MGNAIVMGTPYIGRIIDAATTDGLSGVQILDTYLGVGNLLAAPELISPEDGYVDSKSPWDFTSDYGEDDTPPANTAITLEWGSVTGASFYVVQWCKNSNFQGSHLHAEKVTGTTTNISEGTDLTRDDDWYYWRVFAYDGAGGSSPSSIVWKFKLNWNQLSFTAKDEDDYISFNHITPDKLYPANHLNPCRVTASFRVDPDVTFESCAWTISVFDHDTRAWPPAIASAIKLQNEIVNRHVTNENSQQQVIGTVYVACVQVYLLGSANWDSKYQLSLTINHSAGSVVKDLILDVSHPIGVGPFNCMVQNEGSTSAAVMFEGGEHQFCYGSKTIIGNLPASTGDIPAGGGYISTDPWYLVVPYKISNGIVSYGSPNWKGDLSSVGSSEIIIARGIRDTLEEEDIQAALWYKDRR